MPATGHPTGHPCPGAAESTSTTPLIARRFQDLNVMNIGPLESSKPSLAKVAGAMAHTKSLHLK